VRKIVVAPLLALALIIPASAPALASAASSGVSGHSSTDDSGKRSDDGKSKHSKPIRALFTSGGPVTAVDTTAGTLTYTVRGGSNKALRGTSVTVSITSITVLQRNDVDATIADILVGDHVSVRGLNRGTINVAFRVEADGLGDPTVTPTPVTTPTTS
jgi:hypothetical protein